MNIAIDTVLIEGACPILCLPHQPVKISATMHAVVAWNGSRESARALNAAFPLLSMYRRSPFSRLINPCGEPEQTADRAMKL